MTIYRVEAKDLITGHISFEDIVCDQAGTMIAHLKERGQELVDIHRIDGLPLGTLAQAPNEKKVNFFLSRNGLIIPISLCVVSLILTIVMALNVFVCQSDKTEYLLSNQRNYEIEIDSLSKIVGSLSGENSAISARGGKSYEFDQAKLKLEAGLLYGRRDLDRHIYESKLENAWVNLYWSVGLVLFSSMVFIMRSWLRHTYKIKN